VGVAARGVAQRCSRHFQYPSGRKEVVTDERPTHDPQALEMARVAVGLGEPGDSVGGLQLDDRANGEGLVDADGVEQRGIAKRHRREDDVGDPCGAQEEIPLTK